MKNRFYAAFSAAGLFAGFLFAIGGVLPLFGADGDPDFQLRDGDTVVFLGDSITAAQTYGKLVETYTLLRFPERKIRFFNAGKGGDTAVGGLARLERDVFPLGATVVTVAYGFNDIGWGVYADDEHKQIHLDAIRDIIKTCAARNIRVIVCSPAITSQDPDQAEDGFFQKMVDEAHVVAREAGAETIDVQRPMREIQRRVLKANESIEDPEKHTKLHAADGAHLNDLGHLAMAYAILKGLNAPADVSSVHLKAGQPGTLRTEHCQVTDLDETDGIIRFTRLDERLPFNMTAFYQLNYRFVPVPNELNRYLLRIEDLPEGKYEILVDDRLIGTYSSGHLTKGINIASATSDAWHPGGPWAIQASLLYYLTEARNRLGIAQFHRRLYLDEGTLSAPEDSEFLEASEKLEALQRQTAQPAPYQFVVRPAPPEEEKPKP